MGFHWGEDMVMIKWLLKKRRLGLNTLDSFGHVDVYEINRLLGSRLMSVVMY